MRVAFLFLAVTLAPIWARADDAQPRHRVSVLEQVSRLQAISKECVRIRDSLGDEAMQQASDAAADHQDLQGKLEASLSREQALQKQIDDLKAKYEPKAPEPAPTK